jgi:hypothetical protein
MNVAQYERTLIKHAGTVARGMYAGKGKAVYPQRWRRGPPKLLDAGGRLAGKLGMPSPLLTTSVGGWQDKIRVLKSPLPARGRVGGVFCFCAGLR